MRAWPCRPSCAGSRPPCPRSRLQTARTPYRSNPRTVLVRTAQRLPAGDRTGTAPPPATGSTDCPPRTSPTAPTTRYLVDLITAPASPRRWTRSSSCGSSPAWPAPCPASRPKTRRRPRPPHRDRSPAATAPHPTSSASPTASSSSRRPRTAAPVRPVVRTCVPYPATGHHLQPHFRPAPPLRRLMRVQTGARLSVAISSTSPSETSRILQTAAREISESSPRRERVPHRPSGAHGHRRGPRPRRAAARSCASLARTVVPKGAVHLLGGSRPSTDPASQRVGRRPSSCGP
ncbi:hypothetical protein M2271_008046 [Streptomyces sp. LBL]|nr:hypothetical protein [Streptomyces sp. LBL]